MCITPPQTTAAHGGRSETLRPPEFAKTGRTLGSAGAPRRAVTPPHTADAAPPLSGIPAAFAPRSACLGSKKGAAAVFLTMILSSLFLVAAVLVQAAGLAAARSYGDAVFHLAGRSLLSEYDRRLYAEYGLLGLRTDEADAQRKLLHYSDASLKREGRAADPFGRRSVWLLPGEAEVTQVDLKDFSLQNPDILEKQIVKDIKFILVNNLADAVLPGRGAADPADPVGADTDGARGAAADADDVREIRNQVILNGLPSAGLHGSSLSIRALLDGGLPAPAQLLHGGGNAFYVSEYILARFSRAIDGTPGRAANHERFFQNEVEYILIGKHNDAENYRSVRNRLLLLRILLNAVHIHGDGTKMAQVESLAATVPPGPYTPVLAELIVAAWAAAEGENDLRLLEAREKVALIKGAGDWALDLSGVLESAISAILQQVAREERSESDAARDAESLQISGVKRSGSGGGFSYADYLRLLLYFENRESKLLRIMDLIQINLKIGYYESFLLREHYAGFGFGVQMNGGAGFYVHRYDAAADADGGEPVT